MVVQALPAAAVAGFDSNYFGESAFVPITPGGSNQFAVGFTNTGSTGWQIGTASQVDLGTCGVTQNTSDCVMGVAPVNAAWASNWLSSTAYSTTTTNFVGPGQVGWFTYSVQAPMSATAGNYDFPGDLVLHSGGAAVHRQGYYQRASISATGAVAALQCSASPGSIETGSSQTSTITVRVVDAAGNTITSDSNRSIRLSQAGLTANGTPVSSSGAGAAAVQSSTGTINDTSYPSASAANHTAAVTVTDTNGVATFTLGSDPNTISGGDQLSADSSGLTGCLTTVSFTAPGPPASLKVSLGGTAFPAGSTTTTSVSAKTIDAAGVTVKTTSDTVVTFTVNDGTICNFSLAGGGTTNTAQATIPAGSSATPTLTLNITGTAGSCTVTASASGLNSGSKTATIAASGPPAKLAVVSNNSPQPIGATSNTLQVVIQIQDSSGNPVFFTTADAAATTVNATVVNTASSPCSATSNSPQAVGTNGQATITFSDALAQSCTVNFGASGTRGGTAFVIASGSTSTTITFTGFGAAAKLGGANNSATITFSPATIPANGVATSVATVCVQDAAGNTVTNATDSISLFKQATSTDVTTTIVSQNPQTATSGCATFTIKAGTTAGNNDFQAQDNTRILTAATGTLTTTTP